MLFARPRFLQCRMYEKMIDEGTSTVSTIVDGTFVESEVSALKTLAYKSETIELPTLDINANFSLGYAQCYIDPNLIGTIKFLHKHIAFIECTGSEKYLYAFFSPNRNRINFEVELKALDTYPKTEFQIFCMSKKEFSEYMEDCELKQSWTFNQNGTGIFENENLKGIIRFGSALRPARMCVDVSSKTLPLSQRILVKSSSPEKSRAILLSLISSFSYIIEQPLDKGELKQMAFDTLSQHPKFQPDTPDGNSN